MTSHPTTGLEGQENYFRNIHSAPTSTNEDDVAAIVVDVDVGADIVEIVEVGVDEMWLRLKI